MAQNIQSSTLSLTLPISCQICLGKVKQPVICSNNHVFCSCCIEIWLQKASQCPTCRVPITAESPCREILGGTSESDHIDNPSTRRNLRKTRGELLLREYEGEIESLIRENEDLKTKNQSLEAQLKASLNSCNGDEVQKYDKSIPLFVLEDLRNNVQAATDACVKYKRDMDKLKEANKTLRSQNIDLVQENMRLKAEVANRSPQKFGRFTVATLEARIQQYERTVDHLNRALERSDQYVEDLETRVRNSEKRCLELREANGKVGTESLTQQQKISMMMRSLSDNERNSICSNPEASDRLFSRSLTSGTSADQETAKELAEEPTNRSESSSPECRPSTPSSALRSLTLRSPSFLGRYELTPNPRRLNFDLTADKIDPLSWEPPFQSWHFGQRRQPLNFFDVSKSSFWSSLQVSHIHQQYPGAGRHRFLRAMSSNPEDSDLEVQRTMNAAYQDKISELNHMMLEWESCVSGASQRPSTPSTEPDNALAPPNRHVVSNNDSKPPQPSDSKDTAKGSKELPEHSPEEDPAGPSTSEGVTFDFVPLEEVRPGPSGSNSSARPSCSSSSCDEPATREKPALNSSQSVKRKSYSPFLSSSPTKLSKLM